MAGRVATGESFTISKDRIFLFLSDRNEIREYDIHEKFIRKIIKDFPLKAPK